MGHGAKEKLRKSHIVGSEVFCVFGASGHLCSEIRRRDVSSYQLFSHESLRLCVLCKLTSSHSAVKDLVVVSTPAEVARQRVGSFRPRRIGVLLDERCHAHDETWSAKGALESTFIHHRLLHEAQLTCVRIFKPLDGSDLTAAH